MRPLFHFTPPAMWMNDPNGLVYLEGRYHLFYQHHPQSLVWGPMHWGHAISQDLLHWQHLPVALYPDSLGYIFSGSAVVDKENTTGFGQGKEQPLVAIFTYHHPATKKQVQSLAYSLDKGMSWRKYAGNPVLEQPELKDFRDPKVFWHQPAKRWIMVVSAGEIVQLYSSPDLKDWTKLSDFGSGYKKREGVWECPDLFPLTYQGEEKWILLVSVISHAPNLGSGTQYFIGSFDGEEFVPDSGQEHWLDYGPDNYAGVTWSNVENRRLFIGWMSNWAYAREVPEQGWRGAMTLPRELALSRLGDEYYVASLPIAALDSLRDKVVSLENIRPLQAIDLTENRDMQSPHLDLEVAASDLAGDIRLRLYHEGGEEIIFGYEAASKRYFIDRSRIENHQFQKHFPRIQYAPAKLTDAKVIRFRCLIDASSIELFAEDNTTVLTATHFPKQALDRLQLLAGDRAGKAAYFLEYLRVYGLR